MKVQLPYLDHCLPYLVAAPSEEERRRDNCGFVNGDGLVTQNNTQGTEIIKRTNEHLHAPDEPALVVVK